MSELSKRFLEKTGLVWQPFSSIILSHEDTREITENITGLFSLLSEWENEKEERKENNKGRK